MAIPVTPSGLNIYCQYDPLILLAYPCPDLNEEEDAPHRLLDLTSELVMAADSTTSSYWLNWRFLLCAIWVLVAMVSAALVIWRYEGRKESKDRLNGKKSEAVGCLYEDEIWNTCLESVHPIWLIAYRMFAFSMLMALLLAEAIIRGGRIFYFYTQWTFTLVTFYFGLGSVLSLHGFLRHRHELDPKRNHYVGTDSKRGSYRAPKLGENADIPSTSGSLNNSGEANSRTAASVWGYALQIIFQICAGAVALTDSVFWLLLFPLLTANDYRLSFLVVCMHSVNAVFLLGDIIISCMRFPFFRFAYFVLWTCIFVIFQWIIHACVSMSWPYPFMDLASPTAPMWYLGVGLVLVPCFGIFSLLFRLKRCYSSR